jgi:hypothetical protein
MALTGVPLADLEDPLVREQKRAQTEAASELFGTAFGPASIVAGEAVTEATGSPLAGLAAEFAVALPEAGVAGFLGRKLIPKLAGKASKVGVKAGTEIAEETLENLARGVESGFEVGLRHPTLKGKRPNAVVREALAEDVDFFVKQAPPPDIPVQQVRDIAGQPLEFTELAEAAAAGHVPSFRLAGMALGQTSEEMDVAVQLFSKKPGATDFISNELRSALYAEYLDQAARGFPQAAAGKAAPPFQISPTIEAWMGTASKAELRNAANSVKMGRPLSDIPFAVGGTIQTGAETVLKRTFRLGGLSNPLAKDLIGLSKSRPGLLPTQRVMMGAYADEVIKPLTQTNPATGKPYDLPKAKRLATDLVRKAQETVTRTRADLQGVITKQINDPRVGEQLGGMSAHQMEGLLKDSPNDVLFEVADAMETMPGIDLARFVSKLPAANRKRAQAIRELRASAMLWRIGTNARNITTTAANIALQPEVTATAAVVDAIRAGGRKALGLPAQRQIYLGEAMAQWKGIKAGLPEAMKKFGREARAVREIVDPARMSAFGPKVGSVTTLPFKFLAWEDKLLFDRAFAGEAWRVAYRRARREGVKDPIQRALLRQAMKKADEALKGVDLDIDAVPSIRREFVSRALREGGATEIDEALELAERAIFTAREGRKLDQVLSLTDAADQYLHGTVSLALPFRRTPANLLVTGVGQVCSRHRCFGYGPVRLPHWLAEASSVQPC